MEQTGTDPITQGDAMEQTQLPFSPIIRGPLRFGGVFGIAWQLFKRGFRGLLPVTLLLNFLPMLFLLLVQSSALTDLVYGGVPRIFGSSTFLHYIGASGLGSILSLLTGFLCTPAYMGACYLEMDQCVEGRRGTPRQILRYAVPIGFKRFYTTYLAQYVVLLGASFAVGLFTVFACLLFVIPALFANYAAGPNIAGVIIIATLLMLPATVIASMLYALVYPVAVHENKRAFQAVGRALPLAFKRFWRVFGVLLVYTVFIFLSIGLVLGLPLWLTYSSLHTTHILLLLVGWALVQCLGAQFSTALYTALYIDSSSRIPPETAANAGGPAAAAYGKPYGGEPPHQNAPQPPPSSYGSAYPGAPELKEPFAPPKENTDNGYGKWPPGGNGAAQ